MSGHGLRAAQREHRAEENRPEDAQGLVLGARLASSAGAESRKVGGADRAQGPAMAARTETAVFSPAAIRTILSPEACLVPLFLFVVGRA